MTKPKTSENVWRIRNVEDGVRRKIKMYALSRDITVSQALYELTEFATRENARQAFMIRAASNSATSRTGVPLRKGTYPK